jgi:hypothetical protein
MIDIINRLSKVVDNHIEQDSQIQWLLAEVELLPIYQLTEEEKEKVILIKEKYLKSKSNDGSNK